MAYRTVVITATAVFVVAVALFAWSARDLLLLLFAGLVLGVLLNGLSVAIASRTGLSRGWALVIVCAAALIASGLLIWWLLPRISGQIDELGQRLPESIDKLQTMLGSHRWTRAILEHMPAGPDSMLKRFDILQRVTGVFSTALGAITNALVILFAGLFFAANPGLYRRGLIHLIPLGRRQRAREVLDSAGETLWWWLIAKFGSMSVVGILTAVGLWTLGIPMVVSLALGAAILTFIPNIGPIVSALPAILLALLVSPSLALWTVLLYIAIQTVESYLLTPMFQQKAISLPPVLVIAAQIAMGLFAGILGLIVATPLTAVAFVMINELYVKDTLGDHSIDSE